MPMSLYVIAFSKGWLRRKLAVSVCPEYRDENTALFWEHHQAQYGLNPTPGPLTSWQTWLKAMLRVLHIISVRNVPVARRVSLICSTPLADVVKCVDWLHS